MLHAISIDVEDWYQSTIDENAPLSDRFRASTMKILEMFAEHNVHGTFFVLGLAAEKAPDLVRQLVAAGHEVQSHGYGHRCVYELNEEQFRQDLLRAKGLLEDIAGVPIYGYRAPNFSIDQKTLWALDVLAETGHRYDSSIFPMLMSRYGIDHYPLEQRIITTPRGHRIVEAPITCFHWFGRRMPVGGGGYFRLWPFWVIRKAFRQLDREERSSLVYFHPYEYDPEETNSYRLQVPLRRRLHQGLGRKTFSNKVHKLIHNFKLGPFREVMRGLIEQLDATTKPTETPATPWTST